MVQDSTVKTQLYYSIYTPPPPGVFRIVNIHPIYEHCEHRYIYITAYSPHGYDVISHIYWAASHQRYRGNLTERISGLKPPRTFLSLLPRGEFRPRQTRQLPRAVDLKGRLLSCQSY